VIGPVLYQEMLLASRRTRQYVFRWLYAGWMIVQLSGLAFIYFFGALFSPEKRDLTFQICRDLTPVLVAQQFILLILSTPVFVAGAVTDEKIRGTLQYLLTTDLTTWDIILGKWISRAIQVSVLYLTSLPMLCFVGVLGGLELTTLLGLGAMSLLVVLGVGSASLLASVWSRQTRDAVLGLFIVGAAILMVNWFLGDWWLRPVFRWLDPFSMMDPAWGTGNWAALEKMADRLLLAALAWGFIMLGCLGLAAWRLRPAYLRQLQAEGHKKKSRWWVAKRSAITNDPIRWKERQVEGIAPLPVLRQIPSWFGIVTVLVLTLVSSGTILWLSLPAGVGLDDLAALMVHGEFSKVAGHLNNMAPCDEWFMLQGILAIFLASLVVGIRCSGAISGERERLTWEALLLTPLETRQLVRGKLRGIMSASYPYLRVYAVPAALLSLLGGLQAFVWTIISLAVTLLAMYFIGAAGIWCSVTSKSSWRSLLGTLGFGYLGAFLMFLVTSPIIGIVSIIVYMMLMIIDQVYGMGATRMVGGWASFRNTMFVSACLTLAASFFGAAKLFLNMAEQRVSDLERTRHWKYEPKRPRFSRRRSARPRPYK
jgi:ABC-type transport system involved in multi-copper enzyme maturation permease subunit